MSLLWSFTAHSPEVIRAHLSQFTHSILFFRHSQASDIKTRLNVCYFTDMQYIILRLHSLLLESMCHVPVMYYLSLHPSATSHFISFVPITSSVSRVSTWSGFFWFFPPLHVPRGPAILLC